MNESDKPLIERLREAAGGNDDDYVDSGVLQEAADVIESQAELITKLQNMGDHCNRAGAHLVPREAQWLHELIRDARELAKGGFYPPDAVELTRRVANGLESVPEASQSDESGIGALQAQIAYLEAKIGRVAEKVSAQEADISAIGTMAHRHDLQLARRGNTLPGVF
jgi:hypothetical protein